MIDISSALDDPEQLAEIEHQIALRKQLSAAQAEVQRREWLNDPVKWVAGRLGEFVWSKQREIMESVRDNRLTAVRSCHNSGKSFIAARIACWWIDSHPPGEAFVITTADTWKQVEAVLWRELRRAHTKGKLLGRTNRTEWLMPIPGGDGKAEEFVAIGHRPADTDPTAFHGIHAPYVLVIFDEAGGLPKALWDSADSLVSNEDSRFLAIGNPDDPISEFAEVSKPGSGWNAIRISAFDTPNITHCTVGIREDGKPCKWEGAHNEHVHNCCPECGAVLVVKEEVPTELRKSLVSWAWVKQKARSWGRTNPLYISKVLGEFPDFNSDGLIPMHWLRAAQKRWDSTPNSTPIELGVDVGGGGDKNVIALRRGIKVEVIHEDRNPDTSETKDKVIRFLRAHGASVAKVDYTGIGRGAVDQAKKDGHSVVGIQVGDPAIDTNAYVNLRAEAYWLLRERFQDGTIALDPNDEDTAAQLLELLFKSTNGKIQMESKDSMKRRGKNSPDRADAVMLAMFPIDHGKKDLHLTWGRGL